MDISILKKIGLTDKEIKVYLAALEHGAISVRSLADLVCLNRGTVYDILKKLQNMNLIAYYCHSTKQKFLAEAPENLLELLEEKKRELKKLKESFIGLVPELKALQNKDGKSPTSKFYEGRSGIRFILNDVLVSMNEKKEKEYYAYSAKGVREDLYEAYPDFNKKRIKNKIKVRTISLSSGGNTYGLDKRKWINSGRDMKGNMTFILIYAGKCAFISRDLRDNPVGVLIENKMICQTQKIIFLELWNSLKQICKR